MTDISSTALAMTVSTSGQAERGKSPGTSQDTKLDDVANQFEALFVKSILSSARSAKLADPLLNSEGSKTFLSMLDQEYATALAKRESLGIAEALMRQFQPSVDSED
ncbi:rod-binding protein [Marivita sp.]|uniref:rod-binding protein n=1 Tax=Marivita sp. TaxID=2003365 RepID=UPI0025BD8F21|nr:rod-binding protein [Marivita sp.]